MSVFSKSNKTVLLTNHDYEQLLQPYVHPFLPRAGEKTVIRLVQQFR